MEKLEKKDIYHVAELGRLSLKEEEISKYEQQLNDILTEIEKIENVEINPCTCMISPVMEEVRLKEDIEEVSLSKKDVLKNANSVSGDFISVARAVEEC